MVRLATGLARPSRHPRSLRIFLRKPGDPFSTITVGATGEPVRSLDHLRHPGAEFQQVDLNLRVEATRRLITGWFEGLATHGVRIVRLDAVGYVVKQAGTSCFMVELEFSVPTTTRPSPPSGWREPPSSC